MQMQSEAAISSSLQILLAQNGCFPAVIDCSLLCGTLNVCTVPTLDGVRKIRRSQQYHPSQEVQLRCLFLNNDSQTRVWDAF